MSTSRSHEVNRVSGTHRPEVAAHGVSPTIGVRAAVTAPFVRIPAAYAADPGDVWTPKTSFASSDPFTIVIRVQVSSDIVHAGLSYDAVFQMVNPRQDPYRGSWFTVISSEAVQMTTRDHHRNDVAFQWTDFATWVSWNQYADAVTQIRGAEKIKGLFRVRGTIDVVGSNLFAQSEGSWYKVVP
jgi:hypothetical protein